MVKSQEAIFFAAALVTLLVTVVASFGSYCMAENGSASGIIGSDTTWTKASSPYTLSGPVAVNNGVTLTIESGVTVNLGTYYIQVNGTLTARGSSSEKIQLNSNSGSFGIIFTSISNGWNEQTSSGCIIENAVLSSVGVQVSGSPKIAYNILGAITVDDGSSTISNNEFPQGITVTGGSPTISYNTFANEGLRSIYITGGSPVISHNTIAGGIEQRRRSVDVGSPQILGNTINGGIDVDSIGGTLTISNNVITATGQVIKIIGVPAVISNNVLTGSNDYGIGFNMPQTSIINNTISGCKTGIKGSTHAISAEVQAIPTIQRNVIFGNSEDGISITQGNATIEGNEIFDNGGSGIKARTAIIRNNTIASNSIGIYLTSSESVVTFNNIQNNRQNSLYLSSPTDFNAAYNWWGTADTQAINQTIYDFRYDFNLGIVTFAPFLTEPNPHANLSIVLPTLSPTTTSSPSSMLSPSPNLTALPTATSSTPAQSFVPSPTAPQGNFYEVATVVLAVAVVVLIAVVIVLLVAFRKVARRKPKVAV